MRSPFIVRIETTDGMATVAESPARVWADDIAETFAQRARVEIWHEGQMVAELPGPATRPKGSDGGAVR